MSKEIFNQGTVEQIKKAEEENLTEEQAKMSEEREATFKAGHESYEQEKNQKALKKVYDHWKSHYITLVGKKGEDYVPVSYEDVMESGPRCEKAKEPEVAYELKQQLASYRPGECLMAYGIEWKGVECLMCDRGEDYDKS